LESQSRRHVSDSGEVGRHSLFGIGEYGDFEEDALWNMKLASALVYIKNHQSYYAVRSSVGGHIKCYIPSVCPSAPPIFSQKGKP